MDLNRPNSVDLQDAIDTYQQIRAAAYRVATSDRGAPMGDFAWLHNELRETDIGMRHDGYGTVTCHGTVWDAQTGEVEPFLFDVGLDVLSASMGACQCGDYHSGACCNGAATDELAVHGGVLLCRDCAEGIPS